MKRIFFIAICAAALVILGYGVRRAVSPVASQPLEKTTYEQTAPANGYIVRDESIYYADRAGRIYNNTSIGSRVAKNSLIYTIYDSAISDSVIQELNVIDAKLKTAQSDTGYTSESSSAEGEISDRLSKIITAARDNSVIKIAQYKQDINDIRANGEVTSSAEQAELLQAQKESIEGEYADTKSEVFSNSSGIYTVYHDGFEDKIDINDLDNCTVDYINNLGTPENVKNDSSTVSEGDFVCSVVNNHLWYALLTVETDEIADCETGSEISVRFKNIADEVEKGKITYISSGEQDSNGYSFILVEFNDFFDGAFSYRTAETDLVFESYTGYKIPSQAIHTTDDGKYTVLALKENTQYTCDVDILYSSTKGGYVIVDSTEDANVKLASMERIIIGER